MKQVKEFGVNDWTKVALKETLRAANVKDYKLRRVADRRFKEIANDLAMNRGYIIATNYELADMYPGMYEATGVESKKIIWAVHFNEYAKGRKMSFAPIC